MLSESGTRTIYLTILARQFKVKAYHYECQKFNGSKIQAALFAQHTIVKVLKAEPATPAISAPIIA